MKSQTLRQALASAFFLVLLALAACGSVAPANSASPSFAGYDWQVVAIGHGGTVTRIPARLKVALRFSPDGQFGASDGINLRSGTYRAARDSFTTGVLAVTAVGYAGHDPDILLAMTAMDSFGDHATYPARLTGDGLVVDVGSYTLICHRAGARG